MTHNPFTSPTPKGWPPYHLRESDDETMVHHRALLEHLEKVKGLLPPPPPVPKFTAADFEAFRKELDKLISR